MSCADSPTVDAFVGCINQTYGTHFPRESDIPAGSTLRALYASPIARFIRKPGYLYWGEVGTPWTLFNTPVSFTVANVVVWASDGQTETRPRLRSRLRAFLLGLFGRANSERS